jgi:hypothetical protein
MADSAIFSFNDTPLLFDCDRQAQRFLDRFLPFQDLVVPPDNPAHHDWQGNTYGQGRAGLPRPNYPPPPQPRINTLYWPTGAVRWARGWFLCDQKGADALTDFNDPDSCWVDGYAVPKTLKVSTPSTKDPDPPDPYVLECEMYLLRPLRVTATDDEAFGDLWLLPLVDARYWWQFRDCGDLDPHLGSWAALIKALGTGLGVAISHSTIDPDYMIPDQVELARHHDNAAVVLDAVAHSVGRRVVVGYDGAVRLAEHGAEKTVVKDNRTETTEGDTKYMSLQGGSSDKLDPPAAFPWPDQVKLAFQQAETASDIEDPEDTFWTSVYSSDDAADTLAVDDLVTVESTTKALHCSAWALYDVPNFSIDPDNANELDDLCEQYATDFYGWLRYQYDYSWPGVQHWDPTGYDDHVLFELGTEYVDSIEAIANYLDTAIPDVMVRENLLRRYVTRVQSMPANFGVTSILCGYTEDSSSSDSDSSDSSSDSSDSSESSDSSVDSESIEIVSASSDSVDSPGSDVVGTCPDVGYCTWEAILSGESLTWAVPSYAAADFFACREGYIGPGTNHCWCYYPDATPAYVGQIIYTPCNYGL